MVRLQQNHPASMASNKQVNGPAGMYKVKPYYESTVPPKLPDCMYKMNSYYESSNIESETSGQGAMDPELEALAKQQESILARLVELQSEVNKMAAASGISSQSVAAEVSKMTAASSGPKDKSSKNLKKPDVAKVPQPSIKKVLPQLDVVQDLVISADPRSPPLSLLVLYNLLSQQQQVLATCHTHSSASAVSDKLRTLFQGKGEITDRGRYKMAFTLVWKDEPYGPSLMVNPNDQTPIQGEGNVARYLARLLNPPYDDADIIKATEIDNMVDLASPLTRGNNKERAAVLRTLNAKLGKSAWLVGAEVTLADMVLWSAIMQTGQAEGAPGNVKKWLERCSEQEVFSFAMQAI